MLHVLLALLGAHQDHVEESHVRSVCQDRQVGEIRHCIALPSTCRLHELNVSWRIEMAASLLMF